MDDALNKLLDMIAGSKIAIFIGRNDTGKSTLIKRIAEVMDVSVIDADIGQSDIGPPTVVASGECHGNGYRMADGYFCGSTTPAKHFLPLIAGVSRMAKRVKRYPALVNTTGLATGDVGRMLKTEKINALCPDVIVGLGSGLEYLDAFAHAGAAVTHLPVSPLIKQKSPSERTALRQKAFHEHFGGAGPRSYPFRRFAVERSLLFNGVRSGTGDNILYFDIADNEAFVVVPDRQADIKAIMKELNVKIMNVYAPDDFVNLLAGLVDNRGKFLGLGIIEAMDFAREEIRLLTNVKAFSLLQFGSIKLDPKDYSYGGAFSGQSYRA